MKKIWHGFYECTPLTAITRRKKLMNATGRQRKNHRERKVSENCSFSRRPEFGEGASKRKKKMLKGKKW